MPFGDTPYATPGATRLPGHDARPDDDPAHDAAELALRERTLARVQWIYFIAIALLIVGLLTRAEAAPADGPPGFFPATADLQAALAGARAAGHKGVAVLYEMNGCGECSKLRATTFTDKALQAYYRRHFSHVCLLADLPTPIRDFTGRTIDQASFAQAERVVALPTLIVYDLEGVPVARHTGYGAAPAQWVGIGRYVVDGAYENQPLNTYLSAYLKRHVRP